MFPARFGGDSSGDLNPGVPAVVESPRATIVIPLMAARIPTHCPGLGHHRESVPPLEGCARRPPVHTERRWSPQRLYLGFATWRLTPSRPSAAWTPSGVPDHP